MFETTKEVIFFAHLFSEELGFSGSINFAE